MFQLLVVAFLLAGSTADQDLQADESAPPIQVYNLDEIHQAQHYEQQGHHHEQQGHQDPYNVYLHDIRGYKGQSKVDRIVSELYNPDYIEPITVLDYRYLKTGGRDYSRDAGGQVLILPKNVRLNQKKEFGNYDELLEFLRLKQIAEMEAQRMELSKLGYDHRPSAYRKNRIDISQNQYHNHGNYHRQGGNVGAYKRDADQKNEQPAVEAAKKTME